MVDYNYLQRVRIWFSFASSLGACVALAGTKLAKENEPEENP